MLSRCCPALPCPARSRCPARAALLATHVLCHAQRFRTALPYPAVRVALLRALPQRQREPCYPAPARALLPSAHARPAAPSERVPRCPAPTRALLPSAPARLAAQSQRAPRCHVLPPAATALGAAATRVRCPVLPCPALAPPCPECCYAATAACATAAAKLRLLLLAATACHDHYHCPTHGGGASCARAGGAGAGGTCPRRQETLLLQQLRKRAVRWGSPGGGAWGATPGGTYESTPAGSAACRRGGSGGGQQQQQRPLETLSVQQLCEWAVRWGSPGGGGSRASTSGESEEALHSFNLDSDASRCFFRDCTTVTPLIVPVPVTLADPSGGPVVARGSSVLPCPASPSGSLSGLHLPSFAKNLVATARPGSGLYILTTESALVAESGLVVASVEVAASCSCRLLMHQTLLWHHRLGHPSLPRLRGMHSRLLVSGLPRSLPPLSRSLAPPCLPCVEGWQRAAPLSSSFPPTTAPLQTLHMDVWGPAHVTGQGGERYFLLVVDDYTRYTTDLPVLRLHSDRGGEFSSRLPKDFCGAEGIVQSLHKLASYNVLTPETSPTLRWTGEVGDVSEFRVWGSISLVRYLPAGKLSPHTLQCVFLGFPTDAPPCQFYHQGCRRVLSSHDVTFDKSVCFYRLHPHRSSPVDLPPLVESLEVSSDTSGPAEGGDPTAADTVAPRRSARLAVPPGFLPRPSSPPLQPVAVDSGAAGGVDTGGAESGGAGSGGAACPTSTGGAGDAAVGGTAVGGAGGAGAPGGPGGTGPGGAEFLGMSAEFPPETPEPSGEPPSEPSTGALSSSSALVGLLSESLSSSSGVVAASLATLPR
ncbi:unnamed protein product [Closterium sp. NIES-54]